jgi:hypothetical protein
MNYNLSVRESRIAMRGCLAVSVDATGHDDFGGQQVLATVRHWQAILTVLFARLGASLCQQQADAAL